MMDIGCDDMGLSLYGKLQKMVDALQGPVQGTVKEVKLSNGATQRVIPRPEGWVLTETQNGDTATYSYRNNVTISQQSYSFETQLTKNPKSQTISYVNRLWQSGRVVVESDDAHCTQYMYFKVGGKKLNILASINHPSVSLFEKAAQVVLGLDRQPSYTPFIFCSGGSCLL